MTVRKEYAVHLLNDGHRSGIQKLREAFSNLADLIDAECMTSRERSVAHTNLETAAMWAVRAVALQGEPVNARQ